MSTGGSLSWRVGQVDDLQLLSRRSPGCLSCQVLFGLLCSINRPGCRSIIIKFDYYYLYTRCIFKKSSQRLPRPHKDSRPTRIESWWYKVSFPCYPVVNHLHSKFHKVSSVVSWYNNRWAHFQAGAGKEYITMQLILFITRCWFQCVGDVNIVSVADKESDVDVVSASEDNVDVLTDDVCCFSLPQIKGVCLNLI